MDRYNIFGKKGFLSSEDRKKPLEHSCDMFKFVSCVDLSIGVKVIPYTFISSDKFSVEDYSRDLCSFMVWWTNNVWNDLNGFNGFSNVKFELKYRIEF
jgi:hypothetical protein